MKRIATFLFVVIVLLTTFTAQAQAPVASPEQAITSLLNRIGGNGAADRFVIIIDETLDDQHGKDVFIITSQDGKPCIKGNTQLSVATGINWYLNHYAHINLTWNNLTTDLSAVNLPVPTSEEKHICNTTYRYNFDAAAFSYSTAFWTWERWQKEIDWMALHGINAPLNLVGYEVVTRNFLRELGVSEEIIKNYIAGPGYLSFFATSCLEGLGSHINVNGTYMNGNPDWWYECQEQLSKKMLTRMRELGMQPVIPGFSGQIPNELTYLESYITAGDILDNGKWAKGGYERPNILKPGSTSYNTCAEVYYEELEKVMGVSELYNITPFYDGALPSGITNQECYPNIMSALDSYHNAVETNTKTSYKVDENAKWFIQYWNEMPQSEAFSVMAENYGDRFVALDLNAEASKYAKWDTNYFNGRPYIYCMLNNSGGHNGMFGRLESTMNSYFEALGKGNNIQGIGATPEGIENNTILYEMLFELPWMDPANRPTADKWLEDYAHARYGTNNATAVSALQDLKNSVWNCPENSEQRGASEAVILACPTWEVDNVSTWGTSKIFWDTYDILTAADKLISVKQEITSNVGTENYNHDLIDVVRQALVDYAAELLPLINDARLAGNTAEYRRLYELYLQLMLDLDNMLSYCEQFNLSRWTSLARSIADEVEGTTDNDRNWLEWNARTIVTVWGSERNGLHDYSSRSWSGLIKDYYYRRWSYFFQKRGNNIPDLYFCTDIEYPWTTNFTTYNYSTLQKPSDMPAGDKAASVFGKYFGRLKSNGQTFLFPMGTTRDASNSGVVVEYNRGETATLPFEIGKSVLLETLWIDLNNDGVSSGNEIMTITGNSFAIPADAEIGKTKAVVKFRDATILTFSVVINENITDERTVTVATHHNEKGSVAIEGTNLLSISSTEAVKLIATANEGYNFSHWSLDGDTICISTDNPYTYYDKAPKSFVAHFVEDKWNNVGGTLGDDIADDDKFIRKLTFAFREREPETIYETAEAPTEPLTTITDIIDVSQCASFDIAWNGGEGLKSCYMRAYIDLNKDGDFDDPNEFIQTVGTPGEENPDVCSGKINVLMPYTHVRGITHLRLRFDDINNNPEDITPEAEATCPVYDIVINLTDYADYGSHIKVLSNNKDWGSVRIYNNDTPSTLNRQELDIPKGTKFTIEAILDEGAEFLGWYDQYNRLLSNKPIQEMYAHEDAIYTARIRRILVIDGWHITFRTVPGENGENEVILSKVLQSGNSDLVIPETVMVQGEECNIVGFDNDLFNNNKELTSITLPKTIKSACSLSVLDMSLSGSGTSSVGDTLILDIPDLYPDESWILEMDVVNKQILTSWGTCLAASGENPSDTVYNGGFQLYLQCPENSINDWDIEMRDALIVKLNDQAGDNWRFDDVYKESSFKVFFEYNYINENQNHLEIYVEKANGERAISYKRIDDTNKWNEVPMEFDNVNFDIIKTICTDLAIGVDIPKINIERKELPDPFRGCINLEAIYVDEENSTYESIDGCLHKIGDVEALSIPAAKGVGIDRRALREIIKKMETLSAQVATYSNAGGEAREKIELQTTDVIPGWGTTTCHIWTNATVTDGNIEHLYDGIKGDDENYFQASSNSDNYIEVYIGHALPSTKLQYTYHTRSGCDNGFPDRIDAIGYWELSPEGEKFPTTLDTAYELPQKANTSYTSGIIDNPNWYNYIRFYIKSDDQFWHMGEFELFFITQNGASVEVFDIFKNVITDEFMLGCFDETFSAKDVYANSIDVSEIQGATNALQIKYDELLALVEGALPFELTLDNENPVLYNIQHKRTGNVIAINHLSHDLDIATHKLSIVPQKENNTFQAFYFKSFADGIAIYPYNTDEEVLCSNDTSDGSDKVTTAKVDDANYAYKYWSIPFVTEENSTKYYNIKTNGTYLNDYSDYTESLGFKSESGYSDGSLFNFVKAEFGNDNPRYYQLKDHKDMHPDGNTVFEGTSVGLYKGGKAYREAYAAAAAIIELSDTVDSQKCYEAHEALHKAAENLKYNDADPYKLYHIMSVSEEDYCKGQFLHTLYSTTSHSGNGLTKNFNHKNLLYCESMNITPRPLAIFQFEKTNIHNEYKIKNLHTGLYITSFDGTHMGNESEAAIVRVDGYADGQVTLTIGDKAPMHAQLNYGVISEATGNASLWSIDEITEAAEVYHALTIGAAGYSTLCLNYPVEIPFGIKAYTSKEVIPGWLRMDEISDGIIPANTPVIVEGNPGTFIFHYTDEAGTAVNNSNGFEFLGTLYDTYIEKEEGYRYYVLSVVKGSIGMYLTLLNKDADGNAGTTHFLNNANKVYLKVEESAAASMSSFMRFTFGKETTNFIEDIEEENDATVIYDLQGRRVTEVTQPGLYIINNKKVFVK